MGIGFGRQETVDALRQKEDLKKVRTLKSQGHLQEKIMEAEIKRPSSQPGGGEVTIIAPDQQTWNTLESAWNKLETQKARNKFLKDSTLLKSLNRFRRAFNKWKGRALRSKKIPSPVESGRANYPAQKAKKKSRLKREASKELEEAEKKLRGSMRGARNRALKKTGSSITEVREEKKKSDREIIRDGIQKGDLVDLDVGGGTQKARVRRVNKKSITFDIWKNDPFRDKPGVGGYRKKLDTLAIGWVKEDNGKRLARKNGDRTGLIERGERTYDPENIGSREELFKVGLKGKQKAAELIESTNGQTRFGQKSKENKKEFGKDTRQDISMSSSKAKKDKAEFAKLGEKITSFTENKDLESFSKGSKQKKTDDFF